MQILGSSEKMASAYPFPEAWTDVLSSEVMEWSFIVVLQIPRLEIMFYKGKTLGCTCVSPIKQEVLVHHVFIQYNMYTKAI